MTPVAITATADLAPINGVNHIYPATFGTTQYEGYKHNLVNLKKETGEAEMVQIDSIGSFANRMEAYLMSLGILPDIKIIVGGREISVNRLPHRIYDAVVRDSKLEGIPWRNSDLGKKLLSSNMENATALYQYAPLVLLYGGWDSMGGNAVKGTKIARSVASEIWGFDVKVTMHSAHRINPFPSESESGAFTLEDGVCTALESASEIEQAKKDKIPIKKLSDCGHGSIPAGSYKGCFVKDIKFTGSISLTRLNRYQFPGEGDLDDRNRAGREVLKNLGLLGITGALDKLDLRSGCELYTTSRQFQIIYADGQKESLDISNLKTKLDKSIQKAESVGLKFCQTPVVLEATDTLKKIAGEA